MSDEVDVDVQQEGSQEVEEDSNDERPTESAPKKRKKREYVDLPDEPGELRVEEPGKINIRKLYQTVWQDPTIRRRNENKLKRSGYEDRKRLGIMHKKRYKNAHGSLWTVRADKAEDTIKWLGERGNVKSRKALAHFLASETWAQLKAAIETCTYEPEASETESRLIDILKHAVDEYQLVIDVDDLKKEHPAYANLIDCLAQFVVDENANVSATD